MLDLLILKQIFISLYNTEGNATHKMNMNTGTSFYTPPAHFKQSLGQHCTYTLHERVFINHRKICKDIFNFPTHESSSSLPLLNRLKWQRRLEAYS